jgi:hypothetical protein
MRIPSRGAPRGAGHQVGNSMKLGFVWWKDATSHEMRPSQHGCSAMVSTLRH